MNSTKPQSPGMDFSDSKVELMACYLTGSKTDREKISEEVKRVLESRSQRAELLMSVYQGLSPTDQRQMLADAQELLEKQDINNKPDQQQRYIARSRGL